ncbi:MAG: ABC transporter ATP-binding protein [Spirochaetia bacterium]|jgi:ABC-type Fe3+/spermidine/putrescine transport system ATPase subunit|nr:ABC transporter ATP-binding protein [Spirochaetia bacterium]
MARLRLINIHKQFGTQKVIEGISLDVAEGEFLTLLGPSGCGKTTTLKIIAGFLQPDNGDIYFDDDLVNTIPPNKRSASMCFQTYALFPHMSVWSNVAFGLKMQKVKEDEQKERVFNALKIVGLDSYGERKPSQLSGGQQQRVALARAIVTRPRILLFDEPLSNLDAKLRDRVRVEIRELQRELGITSIYVTHDQAEALVISDRIVVMNAGKIEQIDEPYEIYRRPANSFVADFIGAANIGKGKVLESFDNILKIETDYGIFNMEKNEALPKKKPGDIISFSWRPEDVELYSEGKTNRIDGIIDQAIFMGNMTDLFLDVKGTRLRAQMAGRIYLKETEKIAIRVDEANFRILGGTTDV